LKAHAIQSFTFYPVAFNLLTMDLIRQYFPDFTDEQIALFARLQDEVRSWNDKLNLVSDADAEKLEERHLLSSLSVLKLVEFPRNSRIMDVGTGGGFPGLPLAIARPDCQFLLVDSIGKKIAAVNEMVEALGLENVQAIQTRVETIDRKFDFITGRAVKALPTFMGWVTPRLKSGQEHGIKKGVVYIKGGELDEEIAALGVPPIKTGDLLEYYPELPFYETKKVLHFAADALIEKLMPKHPPRGPRKKATGKRPPNKNFKRPPQGHAKRPPNKNRPKKRP